MRRNSTSVLSEDTIVNDGRTVYGGSDQTWPGSSPLKAKGIAELGICGVAAAVAHVIYNATGARVREYPITLDKLLDRLPPVA